MKHVKTYDNFLLESRLNEMIRKEEKEKITKMLSTIKAKIKSSAVYKDIEKFVAFNVVDPYTNYAEIVSWVKDKFADVLQDNGIELALENQSPE